MTSRAEIAVWFNSGVRHGATHLIVVCDTYDWSDYPVYVGPDEDFWERHDGHNGTNMQQVMEVYDLSMDMESQLAEHRAFHYPPRPTRGTKGA
jgi:hypothetical protein